MTGMEQRLRYIEREIRFMVKDQFGNATYTKFADRVVEDACGIPNFCSTVLSSKRPLTAILRAVRGPRGDVIIKFFNAALHDTRVEMVMVLAEAIKLRSHNNNKNSKAAHEYLMKLYKKANKRMINLITGSKNKDSYKSMYRGLRDFARMDDFDYDDEDDEDEYFESDSDFGDSDFAEACLDAYRDGKTPPEIDLNARPIAGFNMHLSGNEEILKEIALIEAKLGRHLTDAELDNLLCGEDDDDDLYQSGKSRKIDKTSEAMMDSIVEQIYNRVLDRLMHPISNDKFESLDDFLNKQDNSANAAIADKVKPFGNLENASREQLVGMHNHLKNEITTSQTEEGTSESGSVKTDSSDSESDSLPPNENLGGNYSEAEYIDVAERNDEEEPSDDEYDEEPSEEITSSSELVAGGEEMPPHVQHAMMIGDIIRDYDIRNKPINSEFLTRLLNYFNRINIDVANIFSTLVPSDDENRLLTLVITIRVSGDYDTINMMHLNTVVLMHVKKLAERFGISEDMIDTKFNVIDSNTNFNEELVSMYKTSTIMHEDMCHALCSICAYIYQRIGKLIDLRFIRNPKDNELSLYFFSKDGEPLDSAFEAFYYNELVGEGIIDEVFDGFNINYSRKEYIQDKNDYDAFFKKLNSMIDLKTINPFIENTTNFIIDHCTSIEKCVENFQCTPDISIGQRNLIIDLIYKLTTNSELSSDEKKELENELSINGEYWVQIEDGLNTISMNIEVSPYIDYRVDTSSDDEEESEPMTSNFGI